MTSSIQDDTMSESLPLLAANTYSTTYLTNPLPSVVISNPLLTISEDLPSVVSDDGDDSQPSFSGLLFFKSLYFLNGLSSSTWGRFGVIYYNTIKHLSPEQIGILQGAIPLFGLVTMPFWGYVADLIYSRKSVYLFCKVLGTISLLSLSLSSVDTFPLILLCVSGMAIFRASGVLDAHTLDFLGKRHRTMYGTIRMWAAISWGIGAVIMGWITDSYGFRWNFGLYGGMMILMLVIMAFGLPARSKSEQVRYDPRSALGHTQRRPRTAVLVKALCRPTVLFWLLEVEAIGAGMCLVDSFLFVFLQNELNASTTLCGYAVGITVIFELPIFHYSQYLLKTMGHDALFMSAMLAYVVRAFGYTLLTPSSVHWVLLLEVLHGITFACMWIASIDFSAAAAPRDWATTFQSILSMTMSIGGGIGPMIGGHVMGRYGPVFMYRGAGWFITAVLFVHAAICLDCRRGYDAFLESLDTKRVEARDDSDSSTILVEEAAVDNTQRDMECHL